MIYNPVGKWVGRADRRSVNRPSETAMALTDGYTDMCAEAIVAAVEELRLCKRRGLLQKGEIQYPERPPPGKDKGTPLQLYYQEVARAKAALETVNWFNSIWFERYVAATYLTINVSSARRSLREEGLI